jgi:hypothetical protein
MAIAIATQKSAAARRPPKKPKKYRQLCMKSGDGLNGLTLDTLSFFASIFEENETICYNFTVSPFLRKLH